jgi:hypothetical protein
MRAATRADFRPLGSFVSSASRVQLLGALKQLKPQLRTRLREAKPRHSLDLPHYQLEVDMRDVDEKHLIDIWTGIKGALTSAFPVDKPGGVRRLRP